MPHHVERWYQQMILGQIIHFRERIRLDTDEIWYGLFKGVIRVIVMRKTNI